MTSVLKHTRTHAVFPAAFSPRASANQSGFLLPPPPMQKAYEIIKVDWVFVSSRVDPYRRRFSRVARRWTRVSPAFPARARPRLGETRRTSEV